MLMMDLAVPRDIDPAVAELDDVFLYTVDDLDQVIEEGMRSRREAAEQAEAIIDLQVDHFLAWWRASDQQGVIRHLRSQAEAERDAVLTKAQQMLGQGKPAEDVLRFLAPYPDQQTPARAECESARRRTTRRHRLAARRRTAVWCHRHRRRPHLPFRIPQGPR
jgi:hypothetical protein